MHRKLLKLTLRKMKINQVNKDDIGKHPILAHRVTTKCLFVYSPCVLCALII